MAEAPLVSARDLQQELGAVFAIRHRSMSAAVFGRLDAPLPAVKVELPSGESLFTVREARCELELREALVAVAADEPLVVVLDYGIELPLDVQARLARGRVLQVTPERRLARRFEAQSVSPEVLRTRPLVQALLAEVADFGAVRGPKLDLETAWRALLSRWAAFPAEGAFSEEQIVAFAASRVGAEELLRHAAPHAGLREALHAFLERVAGPIARLAWTAWEREEGEKVAAVAIVLEAAAERVAENGYLRARLKGILESLDPAAGAWVGDPKLLARWGALARRLALRLDAQSMAAVLERAERLVPDEELAEVLEASCFLPKAFEAAKLRLARAFERAASTPDRDSFEAARAAFERLRAHRLAQEAARQTMLQRARMALRLVGYLLARPDFSRAAALGPSYEELLLLAEDYVGQGSFADHARREARGSAGDTLGEAMSRIVAAVDAARDEDDRRFAQGLGAWIAAGRKSDRVVPIDEALERFGAAFLDQSYRRLLVLVLDGMSWANAVELMLELEGHHYGPVRWRPRKAQGPMPLPPVMAALPTTTEVSRAALFAGRAPKPGEQLGTANDPGRFASHRALSERCENAPRLLLRGEATTAAGDASQAALDLVSSGERVVGVVVNAIDDQLKAGAQVRVRYGLATIKPIQDLLEAASRAGRAVLLVSDHGHVPGARLESAPAASAQGSRWRALEAGEAPAENEIALSGDGVWRPRGKQRVALLFRETDSYGRAGGAHSGEHGGASIAEVVAPALLIAADSLAPTCTPDGTIDPDLEVTALPRPEWWDLELRKAPAPQPRRPRAKAEPQKQIAMPFVARKTEPEPVPAPAEPSPVRALLAGSPVFKEALKARRDLKAEELLGQIELIADHGGRISPQVFAARAGMLAFRVPGAIARLAEILNLDGYPVIALDAVEGQIRLDLELLAQLFKGS